MADHALDDDHDLAVAGRDSFKIDLRALISAVRRNIVPFVGIVVFALAAGLVTTLLMTPQYKASASVQIDQQSDQILQNQDVQPAVAYQDTDRFLNTQTDILRSRSMAVRVAQDLKLFTPAFFAQMNVDVPETTDSRTRDFVIREGVIALLEANLSIDLPINSRIATISFVSPDPRLAAKVANGYASSYIKSNLQRKYDSSAYARDFLAKQLVEAKTRLEQAEMQLNQYARQAGLIDTDRASTLTNGEASTSGNSSSITAASLIQLNQAANNARAMRITAQERWRTAQSTPLMSLPDVLNNSAIQGLQGKLAEAQATLDQELSHHKAEFPTVIQAQSYVDALHEQINNLANTIKKSIQDQYQSALSQEQALEQQVQQLKGATLSEQDRSVRYNILAREVDTSRTLYDGLLQRYKELSATAGATTNNVSIIDTAHVPNLPSSPNLLLNLALSFLAGLGIAGIVVFLREQIDDVVRTPADIERKLGIPVLGSVPKPEEKETIAEALASPRSPIAEAYHALRTSLLHSTAQGLPRSLLVTSSQPGEGKSTTSLAIARDIAKLGRSTLLIDTDLRRPSLHKALSYSNDSGLSTLLTNQPGDVIRPTDTPGLDFISSGPIPPNPTELLGSDRLPALLRRYEDEYDVVILDGPPVLGLADAPMLGATAEAVLFVIEANRGHHGGAKAALRRLRLAHTRILGAALTKFNPKSAGLNREYGYEYYRYGDDDDLGDRA